MAKQLHNKYNRKELKKLYASQVEDRTVVSFYKYIKIDQPQLFRNQLYQWFDALEVKGRIYVAYEGINAQISLPTPRWDEFKSLIDSIESLRGIRLNVAVEHDAKSFFALIIKVRDKIVADGIEDPDFDVTKSGVHLDAANFNRLASQSDTVIVDMRNHYESEIGHFKKAITPEVVTFRESLPLVAEALADKKDQPIIMYCTGGIRCEKASAYLKHHGFNEVYQLDGGIIKYAHDVEYLGLPNLFIGKNFVFDERLGERISEDVIAHCHQCGAPSDDHVNCANDACHILFIQCSSCGEQFDHCCSQKCADFIRLPQEEQAAKRKTETFNGSKFSKGRYKASNKDLVI
ncbi:MAG: rhodanese-related sulfurtransferase [Saprospiraceae bacterium]|nr:rhodanese-related sulfurtransferase [Saprospiraceae bacterium]MBK9681149.1 rhodanese-related sulfurtransferase [Saprospiraceae bacterium]MBP7803599.1 rhodanese-related sulfurtransferase [Saprospiraceae bacterium]MBP8095419.1 rhodanese-related sulfurtransferase [Saprospiraceae bacterium]MBP8943315.1 rhodanese-related sulfurtransferase [Saprospiraceae bacterium]